MWISIIISLVLLFLSGVFNAYMDKLRVWKNSKWANLSEDHWFYKWAGPGGSWKNKWKLDKFGNVITNHKKLWYYLWLYAPANKERFMYSSTFLVAATDGWHFFQMLWWFSIVGIPTTWTPIVHWESLSTMYTAIYYTLIFITYNVARMISFTLFYDYLLNKK